MSLITCNRNDGDSRTASSAFDCPTSGDVEGGGGGNCGSPTVTLSSLCSTSERLEEGGGGGESLMRERREGSECTTEGICCDVTAVTVVGILTLVVAVD